MTEPIPNYIIPLKNRSGNHDGFALDIPLYSDFLKKNLHLVNFKNTLFVYNEKTNTYKVDVNEVNSHIRETVVTYGIQGKLHEKIREITAHVMAMGNEPEYPFDVPDDIILVNNGALKISCNGVEFLPHSHKYMKTTKIPVNYDKDAPVQPVIAVLSRWVDEQDVGVLIQILAQALYQQMRRSTLKHNYLLQGDTDAGKSTYLDMVTAFCGNHHLSSISLQAICGEQRFINASLENKLLNIYDDLKDVPLAGAGKFKTFTGKVEHEIEHKGRGGYTGFITCPHVFTCNRPPSYDEDLQYDDAWWGRWEFISFPFSHARNAEFKSKTFTPEFLSGLLNLVIGQVIEICRGSALVVNHTPEEVRERWGMMSDPLKMWVNEGFTDRYYLSRLR